VGGRGRQRGAELANLARLHMKCSMPRAFQGGAVTAARRRRKRRCRASPDACGCAQGAPRRRGSGGGGVGSGGSPEFTDDVDLRRKNDGHRWDGANQRGGKRRRGPEERGGYQELTGGHGGGRGSRWRPESSSERAGVGQGLAKTAAIGGERRRGAGLGLLRGREEEGGRTRLLLEKGRRGVLAKLSGDPDGVRVWSRMGQVGR
jgi:hypothetical protein